MTRPVIISKGDDKGTGNLDLKSSCDRARTAAAGGKLGGARRDRTDDLMLAKHALYQLSYGPFSALKQRGAGW